MFPRRRHEAKDDVDKSTPAGPRMESLYASMRALGIGSVLRSTASMDEADDDDGKVLALIEELKPKLEEDWAVHSAEYNAMLTDSLEDSDESRSIGSVD